MRSGAGGECRQGAGNISDKARIYNIEINVDLARIEGFVPPP